MFVTRFDMPSRFLFVLYQMTTILIFRGAPARILWSPCPDVFAYEKTSLDSPHMWIFPFENHRWRAIVRVKPLLPIFLKIRLLVPALLPSKYVGRVELADGKNKVVRKVENGSLDKIKYYVYFPAKIPIPELILIEINSQIICSQVPVPRRLKTILTLEHSLITVASNDSLRDRPEEAELSINRSPVIKTVERGNMNLKFDCGKNVFKEVLASEEPSVSAGDWPWMVPLFKKTDLGLQFFCSSTLISSILIVTAAHCIKLKNSEAVRQEDIVAYVGKLDISDWTEEYSQPRGIIRVFIHPDFDSELFYSDLAILKLSKPVVISSHAAPACLWQGEEDLAAVVGTKGIVFGWGTDGLGHKVTAKPKLAVMPIVSQEECLRSKMEFLFLTTNRTLCAGFRNGTGPCSGDSGGGLLVPRKYSDGIIRWILRGVISLSLVQESQMMCNVHEYTVFTDVAKFQNWIRQVQKKSNGRYEETF